MKKNFKLGVITAALLATAPVFSTTSFVNAATTESSTQSTIKNVTMKHGGFIFDKNGDFAINNQRFVFFKKGKVLGALNNGKIVKINGEKFYQIGDNQFVKLSCFKHKKNKKANKKHIKKNKKLAQKNNKKVNKKVAKKVKVVD